MKPTLTILLAAVLLAACAPGADQPVSSDEPAYTAPASEFAPRAGDDALSRGNFYVDSAEVIVMESYPPQFALVVTGASPTPCHEPRATVSGPDDQGRILVEVYTVSDPGAICVQMLADASLNIPLGTPPAGTYPVLLNGEPAGTIEW